MYRRIPTNDLSRDTPSVRSEVESAIARVVASGRYVLGAECEAFEREFAAYCGAAHCVGVGNGTDALEIALRALGVGPESRVATVANAGAYTTTALSVLGAEPVYVDIVSETGLIDVDELARLVSATPLQAVVVTHLFGRMAQMEAIIRLCAAARVPVLEDCAQAHGARRSSHHAGTLGAAGCFSFYPTKNLGCLGDGGAIVTNESSLAATVRSLRQYGWSEKYRILRDGGRNSRLDEMQAAVLRARLPYLDAWNIRRREVAKRYSAGIRHPGVTTPHVGDEDDVAHLYVVRCTRRDELRQYLTAAGIGTEVHYPLPDYRQPAMEKRKDWPSLERTESFAASVLTLPLFSAITDDEVDFVIETINGW